MGEERIQIVTDSTADLPEKFAQQYDISVVPLTVNLEGETFVDGTLSQREFLQRMEAADELPQTSQPSPGDFIEVFEERAQQGPLLCLTISHKLSGTYQSASVAADVVDGEIEVFDTLTTTGPQTAIVLRAARMAESGCSMDEIIEHLTDYRDSQVTRFGVTDLTNLVKGGRLSSWQGAIAGLLNINALLQEKDGALELLERVRGTEQLFERLAEMAIEALQEAEDRIVVISHVDNEPWVERMIERLKPYDPDEMLVIPAGAVISTHGGRGLFVVSV